MFLRARNSAQVIRLIDSRRNPSRYLVSGWCFPGPFVCLCLQKRHSKEASELSRLNRHLTDAAAHKQLACLAGGQVAFHQAHKSDVIWRSVSSNDGRAWSPLERTVRLSTVPPRCFSK